MAQRRFVAKLMLSCAGANCTVLASGGGHSRVNLWAADTDATYADESTRTAKDFCSAHVGCVVAVKGKDG